MTADRELFYFKFFNDEDKQMVIDQGPIFLAGRIFVVRPWSTTVEEYRNGIKAIPIWVRLDIPKHLWTKNGLEMVSSLIGESLCMDEATSNRTRINYARVCVVVDLDFKFPSNILVEIGEGNIVDIGLDYEWIPDKCDFCKAFSHSDAKCATNPPVPKPTQNIPQRQQPKKQTPAISIQRNQRDRNTRWVPKNITQGQTSWERDDHGNNLSKETEVQNSVRSPLGIPPDSNPFSALAELEEEENDSANEYQNALEDPQSSEDGFTEPG
ncbi:hypothetical protein IFM89_021829 [Coptis chinensis]|uniref:DUF4283 domain-containing protein n=1 Tax=Coptis chinensis TaxID=261450 RepID=A0A835LVY9_9MAGN|nr:hypothetical protein IFM89_021829 [Coptis chinensis]